VIGYRPTLKIGYVSPHPLVDTLPYEFYLMAPSKVMMMAACIEIDDYTLDAVQSQMAILDKRVQSLVRRGAMRIVLSGVPIAIALGRAEMRSLLAKLEAQWGLPCDTDLEAIIAGAKALGAKRIGLATRWHTAMNDRLSAYLAEADLMVHAVAHAGSSMSENAGLDDETGIKLAMELGGKVLSDPAGVDAVILPGGRWLTIDAVTALEAAHGRPVITNYAAGLWAALRDAGRRDPVEGFGMLLAQSGDLHG